MKKIIAVTGTPGTGKTTFARKLAKQLGFAYVDVAALIEKSRLFEGMDTERESKIVDEKRLSSYLVNNVIAQAKKGLVIDSHLSHYLPPKHVAMCIVCKCELKELKRRLEKKGYDKAKVRENLDAEIFDVCWNEAKEKGHRVVTYMSS